MPIFISKFLFNFFRHYNSLYLLYYLIFKCIFNFKSALTIEKNNVLKNNKTKMSNEIIARRD